MPTRESNVTLIWAHSLQRYAVFLRERIAGIDFGVRRDLTGMSENEVRATLKDLGLTTLVSSEFNRLIHRMPVGSYVVTTVPKGLGWEDRKWSVGQVTGGYAFRPEIPHDRHTIQVRWFDERYTDDGIIKEIGTDPSGRRLAVNSLDVVYIPGVKVNGG